MKILCNKKFSILLTAIVLTVCLVLVTVYIVDRAYTYVRFGDVYFYDVHNYAKAADSYKRAQRYWPLLSLNKLLNERIKYIENYLDQVKNRADLIVYFKPKTPIREIESITQKVKGLHGVVTTRVTSSNDVYKKYVEINKDNPLLMEVASPDMFPASLEIFLSNINFLPEVKQYFQDNPLVEDIVVPANPY